MNFYSRNIDYCTKKICSLSCCFIIFLITAPISKAQNKTAVSASINKTAILIGEQAKLKLEVSIPENEPIRFFSIDSIPHFEFLETPKIDTLENENSTLLSQTIVITSFDSGAWVIPPFHLADSSRTDSILVTVSFSNFNPKQDYHDIKDVVDVVVEEKKDDKNNMKYFVIAGGALLIILIIMLLTKKKKIVTPIAAATISPIQKAMSQLEALQKNKPATKEYYSQLGDIFKEYIFSKKEIQSLQKTMDDLIIQIAKIGMNENKFVELKQVLQTGHFVKFAKYKPSANDDEMAILIIKKSIEEIDQLPA